MIALTEQQQRLIKLQKKREWYRKNKDRVSQYNKQYYRSHQGNTVSVQMTPSDLEFFKKFKELIKDQSK